MEPLVQQYILVSECNLGEENYEKILRSVYKYKYNGPHALREEVATNGQQSHKEDENEVDNSEELQIDDDNYADENDPSTNCDSSISIKDIVDSLLETTMHEEHKEPTPVRGIITMQ
jgi:hypothetical protein